MLVITNADDFGLTPGITDGILLAHRTGLVTSTSFLVLGADARRAGSLLDEHPALGVGVHLAIVGPDPPVAPLDEIPTLVDHTGMLAASWRPFVRRLVRRRIRPEDVRREFDAQIDRARALMPTGRAITHLDTHQHLHLWPFIGELVIDACRRHGIGALRVPRSRGDGGRSAILAVAVSVRARSLARAATSAGLATPAAFVGFDEAGQLVGERPVEAIEAAKQTGVESLEICCHPGLADDRDRRRFRWGYRWADELAALTADGIRERVAALGVRPGTFDALPVPARHRRALAAFDALPLRDRGHLRVRWATAPLAAVAALLPGSGRILEVGCGHGLLAVEIALGGPAREVVGVDIDGSKLATARAASLPGNVSLRHMEAGDLPDGPWNAIVIADVLYLMPRAEQRSLLSRCASALTPGGVLVVKEVDPRARVRFVVAKAQEVAAVRVLGITDGVTLDWVDPAVMESWLRSAGLGVSRVDLGRGYLHPHVALVATARVGTGHA